MRITITKKILLLLSLMLAVTMACIGIIYYYQVQQRHDALIVNIAGRKVLFLNSLLLVLLGVDILVFITGGGLIIVKIANPLKAISAPLFYLMTTRIILHLNRQMLKASNSSKNLRQILSIVSVCLRVRIFTVGA